MCQIKFSELRFDHIVDFSKDHTTFAAARENGNNHLRIFLIYSDTGSVYTRNGRADSWEELFADERMEIVTRIAAARFAAPVYKVNGSH